MDSNLPFIADIAKAGILGPVLALSLIANYFLFRIIQNLYEKLLKTTQDIANTTIGPLKEIQENIKAMNETTSLQNTLLRQIAKKQEES